MHDEDELVEVTRKHNRLLRKVNKSLRRANQSQKEYADELFIELCESDKLAAEALERIRVEGNIDCDSDDYEYIIFTCLKALSI